MTIVYSASTLTARCRDAARYVSNYNSIPYGYWLALGKTSSWPDEDNPPLPSISMNRLSEVYGFWWIHTCLNIYPDVNGIIETPEGNFSYITSSDEFILASAKANRVYLETQINPQDLPLGFNFRMRGICTNLDMINPPSNLIPGTFVLFADVRSYFLDWVSTHPPVTKTINITSIGQMIREF